MNENQKTFSKEHLLLKHRLVGINGGSGCSSKITLLVKEFSSDILNSKTEILIHDPDYLHNCQFTRNSWGRNSICPTVFKPDQRSPISELVLFIKDNQIYCQPTNGI